MESHVLQLVSYSGFEWLEKRHVLIDGRRHASNQCVFHLFSHFGVVFVARLHHILCLILALSHSLVETILELADFLSAWCN